MDPIRSFAYAYDGRCGLVRALLSSVLELTPLWQHTHHVIRPLSQVARCLMLLEPFFRGSPGSRCLASFSKHFFCSLFFRDRWKVTSVSLQFYP
jgi:hypothetical protein